MPGTIGVGTQSMDLAQLQYGQSIALEGRKEAIRKLYRHGKIGRRACKTALKHVGKKVRKNGKRRRQKKQKVMISAGAVAGFFTGGSAVLPFGDPARYPEPCMQAMAAYVRSMRCSESTGDRTCSTLQAWTSSSPVPTANRSQMRG